MSNDPSDFSDRTVAREALADIRRILKGEKPPQPIHLSQKKTPLEIKEATTESYLGTVDDLIRTIESSVQQLSNGNEYWSARSLMQVLGYGSEGWDGFQEVILKAQYACERSDQSIDAHFSKIIAGSDQKETHEDIKVTRYGAYLIAQNGDTRKKQIAFAQTYFATQARRQQLQDSKDLCTKDEQRRLAMREKIAEHNKALADAAHDAGVVNSADFARFQNFGYEGLYNGLDVRAIRKTKRLSPKAKILDHMDITELAANFFRATQTEDKLRRENISGKDQANAAHFEVGRKVRKAIKDIGGVMPERLPTAENIDAVRKRIAKLADET
jgi:DNA-damage-inducible protein D